MGKPAGRTLGGKDSDHDRRFEEQGPISGSFCSGCFKPFIPHASGKCRSCRPKEFVREFRKLTPEDEARIVGEIDALKAAETAHTMADPSDLGAAKQELEAERRKVDLERARAGRVPVSKNGSARRRLSESDKALREAQARVRAAEVVEKSEPVMAVCLLKSCSKTFERKRLLQECCSQECARAIQSQTFSVGKAKKKDPDGYVQRMSGPDGIARSPAQPPVPPEAPRSGDEVGGGEPEGERGFEGGSGEGEGDAPDVASVEPEVKEDAVTTTTKAKKGVPSRFTEDQLAYADAQNRPPHNRSHGDIGKELGTAQAHLSKLLKVYREERKLDEPDVVANRRAALGAAPQKKIPKKTPKEKKMPATVELRNDQILSRTEALKLAAQLHKQKRAASAIAAVLVGKGFDQKQAEALAYEAKTALKKNAKKERTVDATTTDIAKRPERSGKIIGIPLEGVIADAEKAKVELDGHKGDCPDCDGKVSANALCMIGRALASRWARLEFIAVSA